MTGLHTHLPLQVSEHLVLSKSVWRVRWRKFSRDWGYALKSFRVREIVSRRAVFGPGWSANSPQTPQPISHSRGQPLLSANMVSVISRWNQRRQWQKKSGGWTQACFCPKAQSWLHWDILAGICTLLPRGVVLPEEGNGDTAAMPTWEVRVLPQPLKMLWKHDTGRAALLSSLIQSLTNGSKEGEERGGHYKKLPRDFCSSSNPFVRNISKCSHSSVYKQKTTNCHQAIFIQAIFLRNHIFLKETKYLPFPQGGDSYALFINCFLQKNLGSEEYCRIVWGKIYWVVYLESGEKQTMKRE